MGFNRGDVSGDTDLLKEFTADVNVALDDFTNIAIKSSGTWQWDDSNHTADYPIIYTNLVDGQRNYSFTVDGTSNLILDIYRVFILPSATATLYQEIFPVDQQTSQENGITEENTTEGVPFQYDKTANGIFLDPIPSYNVSNGIKLLINREASYFDSGDTTDKPGVPGIFHHYFYLRPARDYARRKSLPQFNRLEEQVLRLEESIKDYFGARERDIRRIMTPKRINYI